MQHPLRFQVEPDLSDSVLVLAFGGWNDAGEAATSAVRFLNDCARVAPLAAIDPEEFFDFTVARPEIVYEAGVIRGLGWPEAEFDFGSLGGSCDIVTGMGIEPHLRWRSFSDCVVELARRVGVRRVVTVGAYLADVVYSRPVAVIGSASDPAILERIDVERSAYEGPTGIVGVLSDRFAREGFEVVSLWAGLPHYLAVSPNPRGALALIQKLSRYLDCKLEQAELQREAVEFEDRVSTLVDRDPELRDYVRQLKKRDFVQ